MGDVGRPDLLGSDARHIPSAWRRLALWQSDRITRFLDLRLAQLTQQWEVNVPTEDEAVREVSMLLPSKRQHVDAKLLSEALGPGQARKLS